ncbi:MAG: hypothetical protein ACM31C_33290 [Acidobacteriota bacterium]
MRRFRMGIAIVLASGLASGCATATKSGSNPDANNGQRDSNGMQFFDAPNNQQIDAPMNTGPDAAQAITLSETQNDTISYGGTVACGSNLTGSTVDNIWYRAFQLSDYAAISGGLHITGVNFLVQDAKSSLAITVKVGSYTGALDGASLDTTKISALAQANTTPADTSGMTGEMISVPLTADIAAGGKFVVEVVAPTMDIDSNQHALYIGTTAANETHPGYWSSSGCSQSTPETMSAAMASGHLVIDVVGTH